MAAQFGGRCNPVASINLQEGIKDELPDWLRDQLPES